MTSMERRETIALVDDVLRLWGVWSRHDFAAIINDEVGAAMFVDACRAAAAQATAAVPAADNMSTESTTVGTTMGSLVTTVEVGSTARFSMQNGVRLVSQAVQAGPRVVQRGSQAVETTRDAAVGHGCVLVPTVDRGVEAKPTTANMSTSHYLVAGIGLKDAEMQTESDEIEATLAAALQPLDASLEQQRPRPQCAEDQVNLGERELSSEAEAEWEEPAPVFASLCRMLTL